VLPCRGAGGVEEAGLASSTKGRSAWRPWLIAYSDAAISWKLPPRCTVAARKHSGAFHGMGLCSA